METIYCPRCHCALKSQLYTSVHLASCPECKGSWYYGGTLAKALSLEKNRDLLNFSKDLLEEKESDLNCPECNCHIIAKTFKESDGLTINQCSRCQGVWLDKEELPKTKELVRKYVAKKTIPELGKARTQTLRHFHPLRIYPVPKTQQPLPKVLKKLPSLSLEEKIEEEEEIELEKGTADAEVTAGIWAFTALTGLPIEAYNPPRRRFPVVVISLILINLFIHVLISTYAGIDTNSVFYKYGAVPSQIMNGLGFFTLLTYAFFHSGWVHLIGNMYFLWTFGDNVEDRLGHLGFIVFYFVCALLSAICQVIAMNKMGVGNVPLVGASGAIAGIMGAYLYFFPKAALYQTIIIPYPFKIPVTLYLGFWVIIQFAGHLRGGKNTAWWAHLSGFFFGLLFVFIWRKLSIALSEDKKFQEKIQCN